MVIEKNISLKPYNTFGIDAQAKYFTRFNSIEQLSELITYKLQAKNHKLILGGGSNILLARDFDGLVMKNEINGIEIISEDEEHIFIRVGAGEDWHWFVSFCVNNKYAGIENLSLIPGSVGASPIQNIGAYGVEMKDCFYELGAIHIPDQRVEKFSYGDCRFGYRESVFKNKYKGQFVITHITYRLNKKPVFNISYGAIALELEKMQVKDISIQLISQAVINIRSSKLPDPAQLGNAGSFFKNPVISNTKLEILKNEFPSIVGFTSGDHTKLAAGWLIEQCGWKGYRKGDAGCYSKQALVLVNYGNATGEEIFQLSEEIIQSVKNRFDVVLEREVNLV